MFPMIDRAFETADSFPDRRETQFTRDLSSLTTAQLKGLRLLLDLESFRDDLAHRITMVEMQLTVNEMMTALAVEDILPPGITI